MTAENYFSWRNEAYSAFGQGADVAQITRVTEQKMREMEFDFYALYIRQPVPFTRPKTFLYTNYPQAWLDYYLLHAFYDQDLVLKICHQPGELWVWDETLPDSNSRVFEAARQHGIYAGVSASAMAKNRAIGILSFSSASSKREVVLTTELELKLRYLLDLFLTALIRLNDISMSSTKLELSKRELEILKWTAEGKTSMEISLILSISLNTVNFHQKNMQKRLNAPNKTQIASYAAAIGLI